jgi:tRNA (cmo5U34)-methyltransferase
MLEILKSFYKHFISNRPNSHILDLGCGDGIVTYELLKNDNSIEATLVDGSEDMLSKAKDRLKDFRNIHFIRASFQEILKTGSALQRYGFIVSSLAIHHLTMEEKTVLFRTVYSHLDFDGYFLNIDAILAPSDALEQWYLLLWKQWIDERRSNLGLEGDQYDDIIRRYKHNTDNKPDTLGTQLKALQIIGFKNVDCFYKYGIFAMYGGKK